MLDIVDHALSEGQTVNWCRGRGWEEFLLALSDSELQSCEANGLLQTLRAHPAAPATLLELAREVEHATRLPRVLAASRPLPSPSLRGVSARKREQLSALLGALSPLAARAQRIVDVGAGSGHLSRLAAELFERQTLGVDRDAQRSRAASNWAEQRARDVGELKLSFVVADACAQSPDFTNSDLLIGLHACGELGRPLVLSAAQAARLALIFCCLQKISTPRAPVCRGRCGLGLRRAALGLTNSAGARAWRRAWRRLRAREVLLRCGIAACASLRSHPAKRSRAQSASGACGSLGLAARALAARSLAALALEVALHEREARESTHRATTLATRNLLARLV